MPSSVQQRKCDTDFSDKRLEGMFVRYFYWLFMAAFILSFYVWQQTQSIRMGYRVDNVRLECEKLDQ